MGSLVPLVLACGALVAPPGEVVLVRAGQPAATVVLAAQPSRAAQLAAAEVRWHLQQITGVELPLVRDGQPVAGFTIEVGETAAATVAGLTCDHFGPQVYAVHFTANRLFLVGRDAADDSTVTFDGDRPERDANLPGYWEEQGTLHAAYDFLERACGVRWLNPTELGTVYPRTTTLAVSRRAIRRAPAFSFRDAIGAMGDNPAGYDAYNALWAQNTPEYRRWSAAAYADLHQRLPDGGTFEAARRNLAHRFLLRRRNGGDPQRCNHSLYGYYDRFWRDAARRRPELFAKGYEGEPPQMCYTSRALIEQLAQDARDYYDRRQTGRELGIFWQPRLPNWFPVEPMDNSSFCKCDSCRAWLKTEAGTGFSTGVYSDYFFNFVNEVAKELHRTHPDKGLLTLAYASHAAPPQRVKLDPLVAVQYCFATNRGEVDPTELRHMEAWSSEAKASGRRLYLWLYYTFPVETARNSNQHCWPGFFAHDIAWQMPLFARLGYRGMFHCGYGQDVEAYVTYRLMDDASLDVEVLLDEYFSGLYGAAAPPMKALYLAIEQTYRARRDGFQPARMAELGQLLAAAEQQAATPRERRQVELFRLGVWSYLERGFEQREQMRRAVIPAATAARVAPAGGDPAQVDWSRATLLPGTWHLNHSDQPARHKLSARLAHDGTWLYLELVDQVAPATLKSSAMVFPMDTWEVFVAGRRGQPYRQYASGPTGLKVALSHGEVNFRMNVPIERPAFTVASDTAAPDRWVTRMVWPLAEVLPGGVKPGQRCYLNIIRVWQVPLQADGAGIDAWAPFTRVHDMSRAPEITLAP